MSNKKPSFFEHAWYFNRKVSTGELVETASKLALVPKICREDRSNSSNRLIFSTPSEFAFPDFLRKTIGGNATGYRLYTVIEAASPNCRSLEHCLKLMMWILEHEEIDDIRKVSIERARFEFQFHGLPVVLVYNPKRVEEDAEGVTRHYGSVTFQPFGALYNSLDMPLSHDLGFYLSEADGAGYAANVLLNEFLGKFDDLLVDNRVSISNHVINCALKNNDGYGMMRRLGPAKQ